MNRTAAQKIIAGILGTLMLEFVLGVTLSTVIAFDPSTPTALQTTFLVAHMLVGAVLFLGSFGLLLSSRDVPILGFKPLIGFASVLGAFIAGGIAAGNGSDIAVLLMALSFGAAIVVYGLCYLVIKPSPHKK